MLLLVANESEVLAVDVERGRVTTAAGVADRPTCLAVSPGGRVWCGTRRQGVFRSDDGGLTWQRTALPAQAIMSVAASPAGADEVWAGTEPSQLWRTGDGGESWERMVAMETLPSSGDWSFPPRPDTHHVRWIAPHPHDAQRLWVAIEAGALVSTRDGGRSWHDRVPGGPYDTHELAVHADRPDTLRVAAGDGYFESHDGGATWSSPRAGLDVGYLRSVAIDPGQPDTVVVSASSLPRTAYVAGASDGRLFRRVGEHAWERVRVGWPEPADTIAPLLVAGTRSGELWAADERGVHRSDDGGASWRQAAAYPARPDHLRGLAFVSAVP